MNQYMRWLCLAAVITLHAHGTLLAAEEPNTPAPPLLDASTDEASLFDGQTMGHWKKTKFYDPGEVHVKDGVIHLETGNDMTGITWTGPVERMNYEISLQAQRVEGSDFFCALTFPIGKEYASLVCGGWGGSLVGISSVDFYDAANNETCTDFNFKNGQWYTIKVRVLKNMLQAWVDDTQLIDLDTMGRRFSVRFEVEDCRPLGIATWQTYGAIRNITVRKARPVKRFAPSYTYGLEDVEGWRVNLSEELETHHRELADETLRLLKNRLYRIRTTLPASVVNKLQRVPLWLEYWNEDITCLSYHPSADWLEENGLNPDMAKAIEIGQCQTFLKWTHDQPWMILRELAHAYHHQVLGHDYDPLIKAYQQAVKQKNYQEVLHISGVRRKHDALNNVQDYFAEGTEAFFGTNDFYPFVRAELKVHDPTLYALLQQVWK
jgi:hypothetical protein